MHIYPLIPINTPSPSLTSLPFHKINITFMISQTETAGAGNQYGFYAVPKALQPKKKYRDSGDEEYQDEPEEEDFNVFATIEDRNAANQRELPRDYYVDQAPYPEFKPRERGLDFGVQIQRGDLFDFDLEVRPLIQILVGRSVVSAINELQEEKEREERRSSLDKYQKKRNAELMVTQRLEAKNKRRLEEAERRKLQKELYVKNQKEAGKKIIARKNAKETLQGLRGDILNELEDQGYLRAQPVGDLKIGYQEWLYALIMENLKFKADSQAAALKVLEEEEKRLTNEHKKFIEEEMNRRQGILDERERIRKENEARKEKKRIKKMRQRLNAEREPDFIRFEELMERHEQVSSILKFGERSNGFSTDFASRSSLYIAGGMDTFILALLEAAQKDLSAQEIEGLITKIIAQSGREIEFSLLGDHYDKLQEVKKRMEEEKLDFMRDKDNEVRELAQQISLDLSFLQASNINVKSKLLNNFLQAILSIHLTVKPESTEESAYQMPEKQKKRLDLAEKVRINRQEETFMQRLEKIDRVLRVHFEILQSQEPSQRSQSEPNQEEEEWVDIYDGEWMVRRKQGEKKPLNRAEQQAAALTLTGFENSFVVDQRVAHYLQTELEKILDVSGGDKFKRYLESVVNIPTRIKKNPPVFDSEVRSS